MGEGSEGLELEQEESPAQLEIDLGDEVLEIEEGPADEDIRDTVARAAEALQQEAQEEPAATEDEPAGDKGQEVEQPADAEQTQQVEQPEQSEAIEPPASFDAKAKEQWGNTPHSVRQALSKRVKDLEAGYQKAVWQVQQRERDVKSIEESVAPFTKDWAAAGISPAQGLALLCKTHEDMLKNPEATLVDIANKNDIDLSKAAALQRGESAEGQAQYAQLAPEQAKEISELRKLRETIENERRQQAANAAYSQISAVRDEKTADGSYVYPLLHDANFLNQARPRIELEYGYAQQSGAPIDWGEATKRAYRFLNPTAVSPAIPQGSETQPQVQQQPQQPQAQAVSVRSKSSPTDSSKFDLDVDKIPDDPRATAELAARMLGGLA